MSTIPAIRRETSALWSLHHSIGFGLRKLKDRVGRVDDSVLSLTSATSREIVSSIARRSEQLETSRQPHANWPNYRLHRAKQSSGCKFVAEVEEDAVENVGTRAVATELPSGPLEDTVVERVLRHGKVPGGAKPKPNSLHSTAGVEEEEEDIVENDGIRFNATRETTPSMCTLEANLNEVKKPRRTLKTHASDESTVLNEDAPTHWECVDDSCSSNNSTCGSEKTFLNSKKSGRPGRRQKARRRQLEWEEANRRCYLDSAHEAGVSNSQGDSSSWALGALTSVFESLAEDDYDCMEHACAESNEDESDREDWQYNLGKIDVLKTHAGALEVIPSGIKEAYCDFRQAALEVKLTSLVSLRKAILSLEPCVDNLEEARKNSKLWKVPDYLKASWIYLHSHTLGKPLLILRRMQETSRRDPDYFEHMRADLDYCLGASVSAFTDDMEVLQYAIDKENARPPARTESAAHASERLRVQGMSQEELQAFLSIKFSKK